MPKERKVVVVASPAYLRDKESDRFAARIKPLGLTAYGDSLDEVSRKVKRMFASAVSAHRAKGDLEAWLDNSGLEWSWLDEYAGDAPIEYADASDGERRSPKPAKFADWRDVNDFWGMAA